MDQPEHPAVDFTSITADIVASYVANNSVHRAELPAVIASVHAALQGLVVSKQSQEAPPERPQPPVSIRKSVTPDYIISLEDGKPYRALKRHLARLGLTPEAYRAKWGLPRDYPMVAPAYAQRRSELAKSIGLGEKRRKTAAVKTATQGTITLPVETIKPKRGSSAKKAKTAESS